METAQPAGVAAVVVAPAVPASAAPAPASAAMPDAGLSEVVECQRFWGLSW